MFKNVQTIRSFSVLCQCCLSFCLVYLVLWFAWRLTSRAFWFPYGLECFCNAMRLASKAVFASRYLRASLSLLEYVCSRVCSKDFVDSLFLLWMQAIKATVKNPWSDSLWLIHTRVRVVTLAGVLYISTPYRAEVLSNFYISALILLLVQTVSCNMFSEKKAQALLLRTVHRCHNTIRLVPYTY